MNTKLANYNTRLAELNTTLNSLQPQKILNDRDISTSEELFMTQFGTCDVNELNQKLVAFEQELAKKEQELVELDNTISMI